MPHHRAQFLSGLALGLSLGLIGGHVFLWAPARERAAQAQQTVLGGVYQAGTPWEYSLGQPASHGLSSGALEVVTQSPISEPEPQTEPDPPLTEQVDTPLQNAIAVNTNFVEESPQPIPKHEVSQARVSDPPVTASRDEPQTLVVPDAAPLPQQVLQEGADRRGAIIDQELSDLPEGQREAWREALQDVAEEDVRGIIQMWRQLGTTDPLFEDAQLQFSPRELPQADVVAPPKEPTAGIARLYAKARRIHQRNIRMLNTPGYLQQVPVFTEEAGPDGPVVARVDAVPNFTSTRRAETSFPLDFAIEGPGFFLLRGPDDQLVATRCGRFALGERRNLVQTIAGEEYALIPEFSVDERLQLIQVDQLGTVKAQEAVEADAVVTGQIELYFPNSSDELQPLANGVYSVNDRGNVTTMPVTAHPQGARLHAGYLEFPAYSVGPERNAIELLDDLLSESATLNENADDVPQTLPTGNAF